MLTVKILFVHIERKKEGRKGADWTQLLEKSDGIVSEAVERMKGTQKSAQVSVQTRKRKLYHRVLRTLSKHRSTASLPPFSIPNTIYHIAQKKVHQHFNLREHSARVNRIFSVDFSFNFNFNPFTEFECLIRFRIKQSNIQRLVPILGSPLNETTTFREKYSVSAILAICLLRRPLLSPCRWDDFEELFGNHGAQLSTIFWEAAEHLMDARLHLITLPIEYEFFSKRVSEYKH